MSGSQRRSECATVRFDLALEGRFSALIQVGGEGKPFYLKSGKPQEVTLRSFLVAASQPTHKSIHQPTRMCSKGACGETHNPANTARLHMDGQV